MEFLKDWASWIFAAVGGLLWLARLEWRGVSNAAEIRRLWAQRKEDLENAKASRDQTNNMLTEMRADIKELLRKRD